MHHLNASGLYSNFLEHYTPKCYYDVQEFNMKGYFKMCLHCGKQTNNPKFCFQSCAASFNNRGVRRHGMAPRNCLQCGNSTKRQESIFCSINCASKHRKENKIQLWKEGTLSGSTPNGNLAVFARRYMLEEAGYKCSKCSWDEVNPIVGHGKPILTIDHIDGNFTNNKYENLKVLCYNCHTLTPTFGALNIGNGPEDRVYTGRALKV